MLQSIHNRWLRTTVIIGLTLALVSLTTVRTTGISFDDTVKCGASAGKPRQFVLDALFWHAPPRLIAGMVPIRAFSPVLASVKPQCSPYLSLISDRSPPFFALSA